MSEMVLSSLNLHKSYSYEHGLKGYVGEVTFTGELGTVMLKMDDTLSRRILDVCRDEMVIAAKAVAENMVTHLLPPSPAPPPLIENDVDNNNNDFDPPPDYMPDDHGVNINDAIEDKAAPDDDTQPL